MNYADLNERQQEQVRARFGATPLTGSDLHRAQKNTADTMLALLKSVAEQEAIR